MGYLLKGYCIVYLSPVLSFFAYPVMSLLIGMDFDWLLQTKLLTLLQVLVICIQVLGLAFCIVGIRRNEPIPFNTFLNMFLNIFLVLWGGFTILLALGFYGDLLDWSSLPQVRNLTIWDHLQYATWAFKGLLWILAGIIFAVATFIKKKSAHAL